MAAANAEPVPAQNVPAQPHAVPANLQGNFPGLATITAAINAVPANLLTNGGAYDNAVIPVTSHVRERAKWLVVITANQAERLATISESLSYLAGLAEAQIPQDCAPIRAAVVMAAARVALVRMAGLTIQHLAPSEVVRVAHNQLVINPAHTAAVEEAVGGLAQAAPRFAGIYWYNALSIAACNHHHLPAVTRTLASTTIQLLGLTNLFAEVPNSDGWVMHDTFHPILLQEKSAAARSLRAKDVCAHLGLNNLAVRIPVKPADCAIAMNYRALHAKCADFPVAEDMSMAPFAPNVALNTALSNYANANANQAAGAVATLVALSSRLSLASAFLAGFLLGKVARRVDNLELTLKSAAREHRMTILGSPAYSRLASEYPGTFEAGFRAGSSLVPAQVAAQHVATARTAALAAIQ